MRLRHETLTNREIYTAYGRMTLDEDGYVVEIEHAPPDVQDVVKKVPGMVDGEVFLPQPKEPTQEEIEEERVAKVEEVEQGKKAKWGKTEYKAFLRTLLARDDTPKTSNGYIDMSYFNGELRKVGQRVLAGTIRRKIQDEIEKETKDAQASDVQEGLTGGAGEEEDQAGGTRSSREEGDENSGNSPEHHDQSTTN